MIFRVFPLVQIRCVEEEKKHVFPKVLAAAAAGFAGWQLWRHFFKEDTEIPDISDEVIAGEDVRARAGEEATLRIQGLPGKTYDITVYNPSEKESSSEGLKAQEADAEGFCSWTWMVGTNTAAGEGKIVVTDGEGRAWDFGYRVDA